MRKQAEGQTDVSGVNVAAYDVIKKAVLSRKEVVQCIAWWESEAEHIKKTEKVHKDFPFFKAKEVVRMILLDGGVISDKAMGKSYKRSRMIVEAQNKHLDV